MTIMLVFISFCWGGKFMFINATGDNLNTINL